MQIGALVPLLQAHAEWRLSVAITGTYRLAPLCRYYRHMQSGALVSLLRAHTGWRYYRHMQSGALVSLLQAHTEWRHSVAITGTYRVAPSGSLTHGYRDRDLSVCNT